MKAEHNKLQAKCFKHHWNTYPQYRRLMWMNLNNAPDARTGALFKALGMVAGVPDISLIGPDGKFIGIEFKVGTDRQSESQIDAESKIKSVGAKYVIISSFEEFLSLMQSVYGNN